MSGRFDTFSPPPPEPDLWATAIPTETTEDADELDARDAAALLGQTTRDAEREFDVRPAWLVLAAAVFVLVAYGVVWLSVRNQHPYVGPAGWALAVLYGTIAAWAVLNVVVLGRRLSGRSSRQRRIESLVFASIWICMYVYEGALYHVDHSHAIAYGVYVAVAPLIVGGAGRRRLPGRPRERGPRRLCGGGRRARSLRRLRRPQRRLGRRRHRALRPASPRLCGNALGAPRPRMTVADLDPLIHVPARLRIVATLAALPAEDTLSFTRLQEMIGLTPGNLITHLRKLEDAGYVRVEKTGGGAGSRTSVALTRSGRGALDTYTTMLRGLLGEL